MVSIRATDSSSAGSPTSSSPAMKPSSAAPTQTMMGKRSITLSNSALPNMTSGMLMARPSTSSVVSPMAAAATATTLSRLMTRSAIMMVRIATSSEPWPFSAPSSSPSGSSSDTPI
ncbi:Uncharacterised protein [Bordetella pertussis]|nr:Uncharacterised protein [Bordetella pertussis]